ncbi:hypothetical protein [Streptomyces sp. NPDC057623]|uniref:hypothetical protein n=1 Tax=Streptomyces sp. NPDC057623 TaxID=3346187 RepID=UPI0036C5AE72
MNTPIKQPPIELAPWQYEMGGLVFGHGTNIPVGNIEGLGSPATRPQDVDNPTGDGTFPGQDFYGPRTLRFEAGIKTPGDPAKAADLLARLELALDDPAARARAEGRHVLRGRWPGHRTRRMYGRMRRAEATSTVTAINGWIPLDLEFVGTDPRWYDDELSRLLLSLDQAPKHTTPDRTVDQTLGAPEACVHVDRNERPGWIVNHGNVATWPSIRIYGPVTNPRIWNTVTGRVLELRLALRAGEWVEMETRPLTRWALRNGKVNVANDLTPPSRLDQFAIPRGRSEIGWSGDDPTGTARLEVSWRSAYTAL